MKSNNNKIILFGLALLFLAGIIIIVLKGFSVSLDLREHDTLKYVFQTKFNKNDIDNICKDVFKDKEFKVKTVEVFADAVYIISPTITENEETALLEKLNALYGKKDDVKDEEKSSETQTENVDQSKEIEEATEKTIYDELKEGEDYDFYSDAKVRIRDIVKPYIVPVIVSSIIILIYIGIKYRRLNDGKVYITIFNVIGEIVVVVFTILSVIAIARINFTNTIIPLLIFVVLVCLVKKLVRLEKALKELD